MIISVKTSTNPYDIVLERGVLENAGEYLNLERKVLIVTDDGVPKAYSEAVAKACKTPYIFTFPQGEQSKNIDTLKEILSKLVEYGFTRTDCVLSVGGGVCGDMAGFAASIFMRGIDFYNIPTTLLSQVDSSIGGKTAIDFLGLKNIVGSFYPPKKVIIDPNTLRTLPKRQLSNGLAEAIKMSLTSDGELFKLFEDSESTSDGFLDTVIEKSLLIKKNVVELDEKETSLRRILNFGHTLAHAIETSNNLSELYHGECVSLGMIPMCSSVVRDRLIPILKKFELPTEIESDADEIIAACKHDKKKDGENITVVLVNEIGKFELKSISFSELEALIKTTFKN